LLKFINNYNLIAMTQAQQKATSPTRKTLWESLLNDNQTDNDRQERHRRITSIILENYFVKLKTKAEPRIRSKKRGETEKP